MGRIFIMRFQIKKTTRFVWKFIRYTLAITIACVIVGGSLLFWHLHQKPLNLEFLLPQIEKYMFNQDSHLHLKTDSIQLTASVNRWGLFHVYAQNVSVLGQDDVLILKLPSVHISYGLSHAFTFNYMPDNVQIDDAFLQLTLTKEGKLLVQGSKLEINSEKESPLQSGQIHQISNTPLPSADYQQKKVIIKSPLDTEKLPVPNSLDKNNSLVIGDMNYFIKYLLGFKRIALKNASIIIEDQKIGNHIEVPNLNFSLKRHRLGQYDINIQTHLSMQNDHPMGFIIDAKLNEPARTITFEMNFDHLNLSRGERWIKALDGLNVLLQGTITGELNFLNQEDSLRNAIKKLAFTVHTIEPGKVHLSDLNTTYPIKNITLQGAFTDNLEQLLIRPAEVSLTTGVSADVDIMINGINTFLDTGDFNNLKTTLKARMHNIPIEQVPHVWPTCLGTNAHAWVERNLSNGFLKTALFTLYFTGSEITDLLGDINFKEMTVHYLDPMLPVTNAEGKVTLYPDKVEIFVDTGHVNNITLRTGNIYLTELLDEISNAKIELDVTGPVQEIMALLDSKPLDLIKGFGINPDKTQGTIEGQTTLNFPLLETLKAEEVQADVIASVTEGVFPTPIDDLAIQNAAFTIQVNNEGLSVNGTGNLQNIPVDLKWEEYFTSTKKNQVQSLYTISGQLDEVLLKPYWTDIDSYLTGSFPTKVIIQKNQDGAVTLNGKADITKARLKLHPLSYTKKPGKTATLSGEVSLSPQQTLSMIRFGLEGDDSTVINGSYTTSEDGWKLNLDNVKTPDNSFNGRLQTGPKNNISIHLKGSAWNMSELKETPFIKNSLPNPKAETKMPPANVVPSDITLDISLDTLTLTQGMPLKQVSLKGNRHGFKWENLFLFVQGREATSINYTPTNGKLEGLSGDVGDFLLRLGFSDQFLKGTAILKGKHLPNGGFTGTLKLKNLNIKKPGFIVQAITILGIWDAISGKDLIFSDGTISFDLSPKFTLFIKDGVTYGTTLGITFNGRASMDAISLTGSVIPAYLLNSMPGRIPIIGVLFKDGQDGGLIGVKYEVTGTPGNPRVIFNPLSSMAPGILGRLFQ